MSGEPSDEEVERMRLSAEVWAETSGDWSPEQWQAVNASLGLGVARVLKQKPKKKRKRKSAGPPTKTEFAPPRTGKFQRG